MLKDKEYYDSLTHTLLKEQPFLNQTDLAYELVLREILNGQLSPGEKIPQEQLAVLFGMSRTPVRDALIRLEEDRFLEKSGRAGYQVSRIRLKDYVDFCEFRLMLEAKAAYLAARNITGKQLEQLRENMERFREETAAFQSLPHSLADLNEKDMNTVILKTFESLGINRPWEGDFDDFMSDKNNTLMFG